VDGKLIAELLPVAVNAAVSIVLRLIEQGASRDEVLEAVADWQARFAEQRSDVAEIARGG
jgi:hypothetical protein